MKKILILLIPICILCSSIFVPAIAQESDSNINYFEGKSGKFTASVNSRFSSEFSIFGSRYSNEQKTAKLRDFLVERLNNMEVYSDELSLGEYQFSDDSSKSDLIFVSLSEFTDFELLANSNNIASTREIISMAINEIQNKLPRLFWVENKYYWEYKYSDYKVSRIGLKLNCDTNFKVSKGLQPVINKVNSLTADFDGYVQAIADLIPDNYSDYEKVLFVNDYLCANYKYDTDYNVSNPYEFFKTGTGVCQGYTLAFMAIMDEIGIRCDSVVSEKMNHIWNLVELNGKWYHIDVTWNDPYWNNCDTDTLGLAKHQYFLLSSECMQDSSHNHTGFDVESYGYEMGTEFDEIEIDLGQSLLSSFIELNGTWYNTGYNPDTKTCGLYAFDSPDISSITNEDLKTPLYSIGRWGYAGAFSYLTKYQDTILFNTPTHIYKYDGEHEPKLLYEKKGNGKIYGFTVKDNTMYIQLATNPNESGMENATIETFNLNLTIENYDKATKQATIFAPEDIEGTLIFASYDGDNRLIDCKFVMYYGDNKVTSGTNEYVAPNEFNTNSAEKVRIMIWDNMSTFKPLCKTLEK